MSAEYGIIQAEKTKRRKARRKQQKGKNKMKQIRIAKVKAGQEKLRERIKDALAQKGARAHILIDKLAADDKAVIWRYAELDAIALELRHLAFQIRTLKNAKTATEEA